jgi:hypothetical protein
LVRRTGFGWSERRDDAVPHAYREQVVAGALIQEELARLRDESFDLDLSGFNVTELERLLALADSEGWVGRRRGRIAEPAENPVTNARRPLAPGHPLAAMQ